MKAIKLFLLFALLLYISGCSNENKDSNQTVINSSSLTELVKKAVSGDEQSNFSLSNLIEKNYPVNKEYEKLTVDSIRIKDKTYYYVLLEYSNPAYNRLAIYDKNLNLYLLDKSLNGDLNGKMKFSTLKFDGVLFGSIVENFLSKDVIVKRLSLYKIDGNSIRLSFRTFTSLNSPDLLILQEIKSFLKDTVITKIILPEKLKNVAKNDTFIYKSDINMYQSKNNTFTRLVIDQLNNNNRKSEFPEIIDEKSLLTSLGTK